MTFKRKNKEWMKSKRTQQFLYENKIKWKEIYKYYFEEEMSLRKVSDKLNMSPSRIRKIIIKNGFKTRNLSDSHKGQTPSKKTREIASNLMKKRHRSKEWRRNIYPKLNIPRETSNIIDEKFGYIVGVLTGDGYYGHNKIEIYSIDKKFLLTFRNIFREWCGIDDIGKNIRIIPSKKRLFPTGRYYCNKQYKLSLNSKNTSQFLSDFDLQNLMELNENIKFNFVVGFMDADGSVYCNGENFPLIQFTNKNKNILNLIKSILHEQHIKSLPLYKHNNGCYKLVIRKKKSLIIFSKKSLDISQYPKKNKGLLNILQYFNVKNYGRKK